MHLPDFSKAFEYENNFYLSCDNTRLSKIIAHYELFKMTMHLPGAIVECGVFKGASLVRFAGFRDFSEIRIQGKLSDLIFLKNSRKQILIRIRNTGRDSLMIPEGGFPSRLIN